MSGEQKKRGLQPKQGLRLTRALQPRATLHKVTTLFFWPSAHASLTACAGLGCPRSECSVGYRFEGFPFGLLRQQALSRGHLVEQCLGLLQIERVEAFGEPAVDRSEQLEGLSPLALVAPEPRE